MKTPNLENFTIGLTSAAEISDFSLDSSKSIGPCSVPIKILKIASEIVSLSLSELINNSISKGIFPNICKLAQGIPIFKNDSRLICNNYRPILLLSNISKVFEKVIHCRLNLFLEQNNRLYPFQLGFRLNYSTNNVLMAIVESIQKQLDDGNYNAGVFVDLKKAFDTVNHNILLEKLDYYGIRGVTKNWFESYLNNQKQFVILNGSDSSFKPVSTSVPQGSVLGPLLFLVYINDLHKCVKYSKVYHFADDTNMLQSDDSLKNVAKQMNFDLKNLSQWLKANKLSLNFTKTELIIFHSSSKKIDHSLKFKLDGKRLTPISTVKYLGVFLENHLL